MTKWAVAPVVTMHGSALRLAFAKRLSTMLALPLICSAASPALRSPQSSMRLPDTIAFGTLMLMARPCVARTILPLPTHTPPRRVGLYTDANAPAALHVIADDASVAHVRARRNRAYVKCNLAAIGGKASIENGVVADVVAKARSLP